MDEQRLCEAAASGDAAALAQLLTNCHDRLLDHARRRIGPDWHGKIDAEDVLQDAYCDIHAGAAGFTYRGADSFYAWAAAIVDRRYVDQVRRNRTRMRDSARESAISPHRSTYGNLFDHCFRDSATPSRFASAGELISTLMSGIARLPEDYARVLRGLYLEGRSIHDLGGELNRSDDAVRRLADRALERLRSSFERVG